MTPHAIDRAARRFLDAINAAAPRDGEPLSIDRLRSATVELAKFAAPAPPVERVDATLNSVRLRVYSPAGRGTQTLPGLVYFHGGGLVAGDLDTHDALCATLSAGAECRILAVDYARAPEHKFPAAREDAISTTLAVARDPARFRLDPSRVGVGGDSAGGQLAALAARAARDAGLALALQFLLCPVMDGLARTPSRFRLANGYLIDETTMRAYWAAYGIDGLRPDDPRVCPLEAADFAGLPPARVHVAEFDPLADEGLLYAERLSAAGVACRQTTHPGLIHHFYGLQRIIPAAERATALIVADLRDALGA